MMVRPPCEGCPDRQMGCHDPAVCSKWAEYQVAKAAELAARLAPAEEWIVRGYIKNHRRFYRRKTLEKGKKWCRII